MNYLFATQIQKDIRDTLQGNSDINKYFTLSKLLKYPELLDNETVEIVEGIFLKEVSAREVFNAGLKGKESKAMYNTKKIGIYGAGFVIASFTITANMLMPNKDFINPTTKFIDNLLNQIDEKYEKRKQEHEIFKKSEFYQAGQYLSKFNKIAITISGLGALTTIISEYLKMSGN
jgi:hypothetical protein